jgi:hypothetical protein
MMAHAFCGDWTSACVDRIIGLANRHRSYFLDWCKAVYPRVPGRKATERDEENQDVRSRAEPATALDQPALAVQERLW